MVVLMWNTRGISSFKKQKFLSNMCKDHKIDLVCLTEPKAKVVKINSIMESLGFAKGITSVDNCLWLGWNSHVDIQVVNQSP
jgi:exonuclease III